MPVFQLTGTVRLDIVIQGGHWTFFLDRAVAVNLFLIGILYNSNIIFHCLQNFHTGKKD